MGLRKYSHFIYFGEGLPPDNFQIHCVHISRNAFWGHADTGINIYAYDEFAGNFINVFIICLTSTADDDDDDSSAARDDDDDDDDGVEFSGSKSSSSTPQKEWVVVYVLRYGRDNKSSFLFGDGQKEGGRDKSAGHPPLLTMSDETRPVLGSKQLHIQRVRNSCCNCGGGEWVWIYFAGSAVLNQIDAAL